VKTEELEAVVLDSNRDELERLRALKLIEDQDVLARIARQSGNFEVRCHIAKCLENRSLLSDMADHDLCPGVRSLARERLAQLSALDKAGGVR
jgi:hypothetical protein